MRGCCEKASRIRLPVLFPWEQCGDELSDPKVPSFLEVGKGGAGTKEKAGLVYRIGGQDLYNMASHKESIPRVMLYLCKQNICNMNRDIG